MTVRVNKPAFNLREKLSELERPIGLKGSELMKSETVQDARDLVSAGRKNIMINGALEINQRGFSSRVYTSASNNVYTVDRFAIDWSLNGQMTVTLENDAPTGFNKSIKFTVDTASTDNLTQSEYNTLKYNVESPDTSHLAYGSPDAKPITLSFWVKANHPGKYSAGFRSYAVGQTRGNHQSYRINSPNTWEYKTLTFLGDTEYALPDDNSRSLQLHMAVTNGDTIDDPTDNGNWDSGNQIGLLSESTMDDFNSTAGNTIQWTGFQLEVGRNATEFEHRPIGEELALCQRYYQKIYYNASDYPFGYGYIYNNTNSAVTVPLPNSMRPVGAINFANLRIRGGAAAGTNDSVNVSGFTFASDNGSKNGLCQLNVTHSAVSSTNQNIGATCVLTNAGNSTSYLEIDSEL